MADPTDQPDVKPEQDAPAAVEQPIVDVTDPPAPAPVTDPTPAAVPAEPPPADPPADAPPDDAPPPLDLSSDEGIKAAAEGNPQLAAYLRKQNTDGINEGKQSKEKELRRAAGAPEATKRWATQFLKDNGVEPTEGNVQAAEFYAQQSMAYVFAEFTDRIPTSLLAGYDIPVAAREAAIALREAEDYDGMLRTYIDAAKTDAIGKMSLADVPEGSPLHRAIRAEATRIAGDELRANGIEQTPPVPGAPPTPNGAPVGTKVNKAADFDLEKTGQGRELVRAHFAGEL